MTNTNTTTTMTSFEQFAKICRTNTGKHLCDSGNYYGRAYDRPLPAKSDPSIRLRVDEDRNEIEATISLAHFLDHHFELMTDLQEAVETLATQYEEDGMDWDDALVKALEENGYVPSNVSDNTYNHENDLDQDFVFEILQNPDRLDHHWACDCEAIAMIRVHTGCDIRSGYTKNYFVRSKTDSDCPLPTSFTVGWSVETEEEDNYIDEYSNWYTTSPTYDLNKVIKKIISHDDSKVVADIEHDGEIIRVELYPHFDY